MKRRRWLLWLIAASSCALVGTALYIAHLVGYLWPVPFPSKSPPLSVPEARERAPSGEMGSTPNGASGGAGGAPGTAGDKAGGPPSTAEAAPGKASGFDPDEVVLPEGRVNILLLGIDARDEGEQTRSDTILVLSLSPASQELSFLAIPRDSLVQIPQHGRDKINHAHAFGGIPLASQTVANALKVPIHHYIRIDMVNFLKVIDLIGPVTVQVPYPLDVEGRGRLEAGPHQMDSHLALRYLRERYRDPDGDFGRVDRAQQFLLDLARQVKENVSLADAPQIYPLLRDHLDTDLTLRESIALARWLRQVDLDRAKRGMLQGQGVMIDGIYYYNVDWEKTGKVLRDLGLWAAYGE